MISEQTAKETYTNYRQIDATGSYLMRVIQETAAAVGARVEIEPEFNYVGRIIFKDGRTSYFRHHKFDINPHGSCLTATDKTYTSYFLKKSGFRVAEGYSFFADQLNSVLETKHTVADACDYALKIGYPVIVKPNDMSQGALVTRVNDAAELRVVAADIFKYTSVAVVQPIYKGNDYRVVMLDGQLMAAYQRVPLFVLGDGVTSIAALLADKQRKFEAQGRGNVIHMHDPRISAVLKSQGMNLASVPAAEQCVRLLDNANLSTGGEAVDISERVHATYIDIARNAMKALNLRAAGIDFLAPDLCKAPADDYVILEVNASPGLRNFASLGPEQRARAVNFYSTIIKKLATEGAQNA